MVAVVAGHSHWVPAWWEERKCKRARIPRLTRGFAEINDNVSTGLITTVTKLLRTAIFLDKQY